MAVVLAAGWLATAASGAALVAAILAAATPAIVAALALRRRPQPLRRPLALFLGVTALTIAAAEGTLFLLPSASPMTLVVQLSLAVFLTPLVPLVYALTFPTGNGVSR